MLSRTRMRILGLLLLGGLGCTTTAGPTGGLVPGDPEIRSTKNVPTPQSALVVAFGDDGRNWKLAAIDSNRSQIFTRFVRADERLQRSTEILTQRIVFTRMGVAEAVQRFTKGIQSKDPAVEVRAVEGADGSVFVHHETRVGAEASVRRFFRGSDGVYILAYSVRTTVPDFAEPLERWRRIVAKARLEPNPAAAR